MEIDRVSDLELDRFREWIVQFVVRSLLRAARGSGKVRTKLRSFLLFTLSLLRLPNLILCDVLGRRHLYAALVAEHNESLFIHSSFTVS